jgi:hypothetical protein
MASPSPIPGLTRRRLIATSAGLAITSTAVAAGTASANGSTQKRRSSLSPADLAEIYQLKVHYAFGTDLIAEGEFDAGLELYRAVFSDDAEVSAGFAGAPPLFTVTGPDALAAAVRDATAGSIASQHLIGSVDIVGGDGRGRSKTAEIKAYVQATSLFRETAEVQRILATYFDEAERRSGEWRITRSFSQLLSIEEPAARIAP